MITYNATNYSTHFLRISLSLRLTAIHPSSGSHCGTHSLSVGLSPSGDGCMTVYFGDWVETDYNLQRDKVHQSVTVTIHFVSVTVRCGRIELGA